MIGPFTNDFIGGAEFAFMIMLAAALVTFIIMYVRLPNEAPPSYTPPDDPWFPSRPDDPLDDELRSLTVKPVYNKVEVRGKSE